MYSPNDKLFEMNDEDGFLLLATNLGHSISKPFLGLADNEFSTASGMLNKSAHDSFHLILHEKDKYIRLKSEEQQGIEIRDNEKWVDIKDIDNRGIFMSSDKSKIALRSKDDKNIHITIDDGENKILIQNNEDGKVQIYCAGKIEVISEQEINFKSNKISFRAKTEINFEASGTTAQLANGFFGTNGDLRGREVKARLPGAQPGGGAQSEDPVNASSANPKRDVVDKEEISPNESEVGMVDNYQQFEPNDNIISGVVDDDRIIIPPDDDRIIIPPDDDRRIIFPD